MPDEVLSNVLLESGTNELEVMEFTIGTRNFGINVAKVVEILRYSEITPMPNTSPCIEGIFKPRNEIITVVNLPKYLSLSDADIEPDPSKDILIITKFNSILTAFHVNTVEGINRISWSDIEKPDPAIYGGNDGIATGIARYNDRLITILDFEKILTELNPETSMKVSDRSLIGREINNAPILVAEDSTVLMRMITENLERAGYTNIITCYNGQEALEILEEFKNLDGKVSDYVKLVITDIEMPMIDGHRLIKLIREDATLKHTPCIIFSSLISDEMIIKGTEVGATAQISKPEIISLIAAVDNLLDQYK